jgi:hypothetical protein
MCYEKGEIMEEKKLSFQQSMIIEYLRRGGGYVSPTRIGNVIGTSLGFTNWHSAWASPKCLKLVKLGLLERNKHGWYKIKG